MSAVALTVNGKAVTGDVDPRTLLVQFLRENLRLTGTHVGSTPCRRRSASIMDCNAAIAPQA